MCGLSRAGPLPKCGVLRWRFRARLRSAHRTWQLRNGGKRSATAYSSITTRTRRTARRVRHIPCARCRMRAYRRRSNGMKFRKAIQPISRCLRFRSDSRNWEIRTQSMDAAAGSLEKLLELADRRRSSGFGRCAVASALPQNGGRGKTCCSFALQVRAAKQPRKQDAAIGGCELAGQSGRSGGSGEMEEQASRGGRLPRGRRCAGGFDAGTVVHLDAHTSESAECA